VAPSTGCQPIATLPVGPVTETETSGEATVSTPPTEAVTS
jgi:hypothetical protein